MHSVTRCVLPALIVLIGIAPARAQEKTSERDTVVVYKLRQAPRVMLRTSPRPALRMAPRAALRARAVRAPLMRMEREALAARTLRRALNDTDRVRRLRRGDRPRFFRDRDAFRFEMPPLRMHIDSFRGNHAAFRLHLDSLMGDREAFRLRIDSLFGDRSAFRKRLDTMLADGTRLRLFRDSLRDFRFDVEPLRELRPFRMRDPEGRFFREGGPGERRLFRDGERLRAPRPRMRLRDGEVEIERDDEGRVRVYRFDRPEGDVRPGPGARVERHVLRVGPDGEITGDTDGVRVERDDDGGVRIYIPPRETRPRTPQPPRTRSRD